MPDSYSVTPVAGPPVKTRLSPAPCTPAAEGCSAPHRQEGASGTCDSRDGPRGRYGERSSRSQKDRNAKIPGSRRAWGGNKQLFFNGMDFQSHKTERALEMDSGDGCRTLYVYLIPLDRALKNG